LKYTPTNNKILIDTLNRSLFSSVRSGLNNSFAAVPAKKERMDRAEVIRSLVSFEDKHAGQLLLAGL
jgi:hypothetical protein